jgi:hypothetical protein
LFLFDLFRSFLPLHNPLGFGALDFIELAVAALLTLFLLAQLRFNWLISKPVRCMLAIGVAPILLRLALLPHYPVPTAAGSDDFSYLLLADTLQHFRLANPVHPMHRFFEGIFVLQEPSYASIYPLGQGIVLALFGHPWAGVLISAGAFCALVYWMLRGWTTPGWAAVGGLLAVIQFGPLCGWMNLYWGGYVSATAGCLVFGSLPRLRANPRSREAILLGAGLAIQLLTRPFEFVLFVLCIPLFFLPARRTLAIVALMLAPAAGLTLLHNHATTGSWTTLPYQLSRYQYGVPTGFTTQPNPSPHRPLTMEQELDYRAQSAVHDGAGNFFVRLAERFRFYRFFFLPPLYIAALAFLWRLREYRYLAVLLAIAIFALGTNFYPYFYPQYIAAATCLFVLVSVAGLANMNSTLARWLVILCCVHFTFWYGLHLLGSEDIRVAMMRVESWDFINYGDPDGRLAVNSRLALTTGRQLVFVRYGPRHGFHSWIRNAADIDASRIVWAGDLGPDDNQALTRYYPDRTVWLLEPDAQPPRLTPYARPATAGP